MFLANPILYCVAALLSGVSSFFLFYFGTKIFEKYGLLDNPGPYGHKRNPVPLGFGIFIYLNFIVISGILIYLGLIDLSNKLIILMVLGGIVTGVSFVDDLDTIYKFERKEKNKPLVTQEELSRVRKTRFAISAKMRLVLQILVGLIVGLTSIKISYISNIFGGILHLDFFSISVFGYEVFLIPLVFTVFWYVLVFNSVNWSDGVPGLTIGLASITLIIIFVLTIRLYIMDETPALRQNSIFVFETLSILIPSLLLAWWYNLVPKMLLGESGTMFIAFIIASLAILVGGKVATVATALGIYLVDAIYVIFARILNKKNPLKGDRIHHLHYRLQAIGMSDAFIRNFVYSIALFFGISAVFLDKTGKVILFIALIIVIVFITKILSLKNAKSGFTMVELLIVISIISIVSMGGFKMYSNMEERSKNEQIQGRVQSFIKKMDSQITEGNISDYSIQFSKDARGLIAKANTLQSTGTTDLGFDWNAFTGVLTFSKVTSPEYRLISENHAYYSIGSQTGVTEMELPLVLSGSFDSPQKVLTKSNGIEKTSFYIFSFDPEGKNSNYSTTLAFSGATYTGAVLVANNSGKKLFDVTGGPLSSLHLLFSRRDSQFEYTLTPGK